MRILGPADVAPEIRIDDAHDNFVAFVHEERLQLGRQQIERAAHDEAVGVESPRKRRRRREREDQPRGDCEKPSSHIAMISDCRS